MKKLVVLIVAIFLVTGMAFAGVDGTKHDIPGYVGNTFSGAATVATAEICVYCHTPHSANTLVDTLLWNRTFGTQADAFAIYSSATSTAMNGVTDLSTVAKLCLSCHDGSTAVYVTGNPANSGMVTAVNAVGNVNATGNIIGNGILTKDMSNDHPIGFDYATVQGVDGGLRAPATMTLPLQSGIMDCSTCHNVHDDTFSPFLRMDNAASAMCIHCHIDK
jgi:predicted CXXCH cytochrome family protein